MTEHPLFVVPVTVALIVLSAFFVIIEFSLLGARRHRLEAEAADSITARAALRGVNELTMMLAVAQLGITACTFALGAVTKPAVDHWTSPLLVAIGAPAWLADGAAFAFSLLLVTFLHLVIGEMMPKSWAIAHPEFAARLIGVPARILARPLRPLLHFVNAIANRLVAASGVEPVERAAAGGQDADTIRQLVEASAQAGTLDRDRGDQLSAVFDLRELTLADLVPAGAPTPTTVPAGATVADLRAATVRTGHLRVLVEDPAGGVPAVVHVRDTLLSDTEAPVAPLGRDPLVLVDTLHAHEALTRMRESGEQLALVVAGDGDSPVRGVVTVNDLVTRILPHEDVPV
ncbi:hemolysin family protein [Brevibacterium litoralis]|uniref:hemolysin family protein n=1 Tax=Brevibacterium litoralis TaxID=3138935 RepID=UPI0032ECEA24